MNLILVMVAIVLLPLTTHLIAHAHLESEVKTVLKVGTGIFHELNISYRTFMHSVIIIIIYIYIIIVIIIIIIIIITIFR